MIFRLIAAWKNCLTLLQCRLIVASPSPLTVSKCARKVVGIACRYFVQSLVAKEFRRVAVGRFVVAKRVGLGRCRLAVDERANPVFEARHGGRTRPVLDKAGFHKPLAERFGHIRKPFKRCGAKPAASLLSGYQIFDVPLGIFRLASVTLPRRTGQRRPLGTTTKIVRLPLLSVDTLAMFHLFLVGLLIGHNSKSSSSTRASKLSC